MVFMKHNQKASWGYTLKQLPFSNMFEVNSNGGGASLVGPVGNAIETARWKRSRSQCHLIFSSKHISRIHGIGLGPLWRYNYVFLRHNQTPCWGYTLKALYQLPFSKIFEINSTGGDMRLAGSAFAANNRVVKHSSLQAQRIILHGHTYTRIIAAANATSNQPPHRLYVFARPSCPSPNQRYRKWNWMARNMHKISACASELWSFCSFCNLLVTSFDQTQLTDFFLLASKYLYFATSLRIARWSSTVSVLAAEAANAKSSTVSALAAEAATTVALPAAGVTTRIVLFFFPLLFRPNLPLILTMVFRPLFPLAFLLRGRWFGAFTGASFSMPQWRKPR